MLENYTRVRLETDKYQEEGASQGDLGYVIEVYPGGNYEVEFSRPDGTTFAQITAKESDIQQDEPLLTVESKIRDIAVVETTYLPPSPSKHPSKSTRSNIK